MAPGRLADGEVGGGFTLGEVGFVEGVDAAEDEVGIPVWPGGAAQTPADAWVVEAHLTVRSHRRALP